MKINFKTSSFVFPTAVGNNHRKREGHIFSLGESGYNMLNNAKNGSVKIGGVDADYISFGSGVRYLII